jgi:hypothetical protein
MAKKAIDILTGEDNDISIRFGDWNFGESDAQHVQHIGQAEKGNYAQNPTVGVGAMRFLNGNTTPDEIARNYRLELERDGYQVNSIKVKNQAISIDAERIR